MSLVSVWFRFVIFLKVASLNLVSDRRDAMDRRTARREREDLAVVTPHPSPDSAPSGVDPAPPGIPGRRVYVCVCDPGRVVDGVTVTL